jgi:hypothetical protein
MSYLGEIVPVADGGTGTTAAGFTNDYLIKIDTTGAVPVFAQSLIQDNLFYLDVQKVLQTKALRALNGVSSYATSRSIIATAGQVYLLSGSGQSYAINTAGLTTGDMFYVGMQSGCPANSLTYTDAFGVATSLSLSTTATSFYTFHWTGTGFLVYGGYV